MKDTAHRAVAIVGVGAILPDAPNVKTFWDNLKSGRYSISDVDPERWDPELYYDADPKAPDKTYSKIGGWVRDWEWDPMSWRLPIPPKVGDAMDEAQRWAVNCTRAVLADFGYPERKLDPDRTAVILGNAMAGEKHYLTALRVNFPEFARELDKAPSFDALPEDVQQKIIAETQARVRDWIPDITEDTMPGELANVMAGRIANLFNLHGPNFVVDAACASAMAAMTAAIEGLEEHDYDAVITGGIDRNMGAATYVKFCKIGALSATGTRPYANGADGFVMGEGAALFLLKRLADAERDGDHIYAVIRGMGGSSDGKGKGITAPNPVGQKLAVQRAWENAGESPSTATMVEGHGTSTAVGDVVEVQSLIDVFSGAGAAQPNTIALGSVKSNIGHLKGAAGAAGMLKAALALDEKVLPPSLNCAERNPKIDFEHSPFYVNTELKDWDKPECGVRRAAVSAFGFGGTNFHAVLEEHIPGRLTTERPFYSVSTGANGGLGGGNGAGSLEAKKPPRGAVLLGGEHKSDLSMELRELKANAEASKPPAHLAPAQEYLDRSERLAIDFKDPKDLSSKIDLALKAMDKDTDHVWKALGPRGIYRGSGAKPKVAFLFPGQGSQYVNMLRDLSDLDPIVKQTFDEADKVMEPLLGKKLTDFIFVDSDDEAAMKQAAHALKQTEITQPAVLTVDVALTRMLKAYGVEPDMVMGHSLGEYAALVASGAMTFADALEAVSARGREMAHVSVDDNGKMAAVFAPLEDVQRAVAAAEGYVVIANINSNHQAVIGGATEAVEALMKSLTEQGIDAREIPVSHAFHTSIVAPASEPLRKVLERIHIQAPKIPTISNVTGDFYPEAHDAMVDAMARQVASPVQFVKGLESLYDAGARVFIEVGAKRALQGFAEDVLKGKDGFHSLCTNHPKVGGVASLNQALCGVYAAGLGTGRLPASAPQSAHPAAEAPAPVAAQPTVQPSVAAAAASAASAALPAMTVPPAAGNSRYEQLGRMFSDFMSKASGVAGGVGSDQPLVITGAGLGLPGTPKVFDDANVGRILHGEQFIDAIPHRLRNAMVDKHITRLVKREDSDPTFETIDKPEDVVKLAGRLGQFELDEEYGVDPGRASAMDSTTAMAMAAGFDALRDAGIPLVQAYKTTTKGTKLPDRWRLPDNMRDDTGIIFGSAFPGYDAFAGEMEKYYEDHGLREQRQALTELKTWLETQGHGGGNGSATMLDEVDRRIDELNGLVNRDQYNFDRRFIFKILSMGHSQFAEEIGARGPNTQVNGACASTTQAVALAEDWIRNGRCRRVIVVSADNVSSDNLAEWIGSGFLASGAAATDEQVEKAALPFDKRRHGMIMGAGAAAIVVESPDSARERGVTPIAELLGAVTANSAFHGTRLDINHIAGLMEDLVSGVETRHGIRREEIAPKALFMSHETYTPARGGSASAEIHALRSVFGPMADRVVITNTKGFTGHAMGAGLEDVVSLKALETGLVPPVANYKEPDPELGELNLSRGGSYPVQYALRLGAGFGSQIAMSLTRAVPSPDGRRRGAHELGFHYRVDHEAWKQWLSEASGYPKSEVEVVQRRLRIKDQGPAAAFAKPAAQQAVQPAAQPAAAPAPQPVPQPVAAPAAAAPTPQPAAQPVAEPAPPAPEPVAAAVEDPVATEVLRVVAESTGYPKDMLDMELDLEADLGIDTVKQAEVFAAIRGVYDIPRDENLALRDFPTLQHVVGFVRDRRPDLPAPEAAAPAPAAAPATAAPETAPAPAAEAPVGDSIEQKVIELVAEKTGYPADMLDPELDMEADLGIDTVKQAEVFATIRGAYDIPRDENLQLRDFPTLGHVAKFVKDKRPDLAQEAAAASAAQSAAQAAAVAPPPQPAPAPAAAPAPEPAPTASGSDAGSDAIRAQVLKVVAETTGYPEDMLDFDLDLEADLGVDTVKQAEMFAAIRESFDVERDPDLQLRDYPTLNHVISFFEEKRPDLVAAAPAPHAPATQAAPPAAPTPAAAIPGSDGGSDAIRAQVLEVVAETTGYPEDMLDFDLDLEADLGVDTVKQAEMFAAIRERFDVERDPDLQLRDYPTLNHVIAFFEEKRPDLVSGAAPAPAASPAEPAAAPAEPAAAPAEDTDAATDAVKAQVLAVVAETTGYPEDMLDFELDLEADLGIDTVKQAEMFAKIRESFGVERDPDLQLRDYPTLNHVIGFFKEKRPDLAEGGAGEAAPSAAKPSETVHVEIPKGDMDAANAVPRRVPMAVWRPELDAFESTGIELGEGTRVVLMPDHGGVGKSLASRLEKKGVDVLTIEGTPAADDLTQQLEAWLADGDIHGVYWLPALDAEGGISDMSLDDWRENLRIRAKLLYTTMRALSPSIKGEGRFLIAATRLGGRHGYDESGARNPMGGAVCGFVKAFKRERDEVLCKVVDFPAGRKKAPLADRLMAETERDAGVVEAGWDRAGRWTVGLDIQDAPTDLSVNELTRDSVVVVTGAAGSIVSAIVADMAEASGATFHLLDLTPRPDPEDEDLKAFIQDRDGLKMTLFERLKAEGKKATPAVIEKQLAGLERLQAALAAIEAVEQAGGKAVYHSVNLTDADAVRAAVDAITAEHEQVDVLLHAAGLEISHFIDDKPPQEFDLVLDVKSDGWFNLLKALGDTPLKSAVVFSSVAGRFGNGGQTDYSAANDLLCKYTSSFRNSREDCAGLAIDWTAWADIGMASRGSIPKMMEFAGIDMLPPAAGIPIIRREITAGVPASEIVIGQRLGILTASKEGGLEAIDTESCGPMIGRVVGFSPYEGLVVETELDPLVQPFLFDHQIDGTPVLPGVMGLESFAELTTLLLPEWQVVAEEDVQFLAPFKFYRNEPRTVRLTAAFKPDGDDLVAHCSLSGSRMLPTSDQPQVTTHFVARVRLSKADLDGRQVDAPAKAKGEVLGSEAVYKVYFHGPAYQVLDGAWTDGNGSVIGQFKADIPANHSPEDRPLSISPRLIELCFQTAGMSELGLAERFGLPAGIGKVLRHAPVDPAKADGLFAVVTQNGEGFDADVVDESGNVYLQLIGYQTVEIPGMVAAEDIKPIQSVIGA